MESDFARRESLIPIQEPLKTHDLQPCVFCFPALKHLPPMCAQAQYPPQTTHSRQFGGSSTQFFINSRQPDTYAISKAFCKFLFIRHLECQKIQAIYFKIQGTYFKICALCFLQQAMYFFAHREKAFFQPTLIVFRLRFFHNKVKVLQKNRLTLISAHFGENSLTSNISRNKFFTKRKADFVL